MSLKSEDNETSAIWFSQLKQIHKDNNKKREKTFEDIGLTNLGSFVLASNKHLNTFLYRRTVDFAPNQLHFKYIMKGFLNGQYEQE